MVSNNIGALFGADISPDLLHVHYEETTLTTSTGTATFEAEVNDGRHHAVDISESMSPHGQQMYATNPNYNSKKNIFVLFINERLVSSTTIKKGLLSVYNEYLPRGTHPFLYGDHAIVMTCDDIISEIEGTTSECGRQHQPNEI